MGGLAHPSQARGIRAGHRWALVRTRLGGGNSGRPWLMEEAIFFLCLYRPPPRHPVRRPQSFRGAALGPDAIRKLAERGRFAPAPADRPRVWPRARPASRPRRLRPPHVGAADTRNGLDDALAVG